jgi:hypothetical protein
MFRRHSTESIFALPFLVFLVLAALVICSNYVDVVSTKRLLWIIAGCIALMNFAVFFARSGSVSILNKNLNEGVSKTIDKNLSFFCTKITNRISNGKEAYHQIIDFGNFCIMLLEGDLMHIEGLENRLSKKDMLDQEVKIKYVARYSVPMSSLDKDNRGGHLEIKIGKLPVVIVRVW